MKSVEDYAREVIKSGNLSKRATLVVNQLLKNGVINTEDLEQMGYNHPPRAIRDVREAGIPLITSRIHINGRLLGEYRFGRKEDIQENKLAGRVTFPKTFKTALLEIQGNRCAICNQEFDSKYLQIDHRVPYEYNGDSQDLDTSDYMLLCAECNRKKDRATETGCRLTCFKTNNIDIIRSCYWASPENYSHICMKPIRHVDITFFNEHEVKTYDQIKLEANEKGILLQDYLKNILENRNQ